MKITFRKSEWVTVDIDNFIKEIAIHNPNISGTNIYKVKNFKYIMFEILNKIASNLTDKDDMINAESELQTVLIKQQHKVRKLWDNAQNS